MFSLLPPHIGKRDVSHVIARPTGRGNLMHNQLKDCHETDVRDPTFVSRRKNSPKGQKSSHETDVNHSTSVSRQNEKSNGLLEFNRNP